MGVHRPGQVTRLARQNAASIAGLMLTTEALVAELKEEEKKAAAAGAPAQAAWWHVLESAARAFLPVHVGAGSLW